MKLHFEKKLHFFLKDSDDQSSTWCHGNAFYICEGKPLMTDGFPSWRDRNIKFCLSPLVITLNKLLKKLSRCWWFEMPWCSSDITVMISSCITQITKFMGPTWGPPGSCRPQMGPMLAPWTLLSGKVWNIWVRSWNCGCLVTWFPYQLIAKPGNKTATVLWPDPSVVSIFEKISTVIPQYTPDAISIMYMMGGCCCSRSPVSQHIMLYNWLHMGILWCCNLPAKWMYVWYL